METLVVNDVTYCTHGLIFSPKKFNEFYDNIEEDLFVDSEFPPDNKSILGLGCGVTGDRSPIDRTA